MTIGRNRYRCTPGHRARTLTAAAWLAVAVGIAALAGLAATAAVAPDAAADAKVAETLFKSGKQAYSKGDYAGAITYFQKAIEEDTTLLEASWWCAAAQEKLGDKGAALTTYREFLALVSGKPAATKEELRLKALAEKSVESLAAGEKESKKLEDAFVGNLMQFAKDNFVRDPGVALKALAQILAVRPDHSEALKLREKLGGGAADGPSGASSGGASEKGAAGPATGPFREVKSWKDFLEEQTIKSNVITYDGKVMTVETKGGSLIRNDSPLDFGTSYAYEMEFRVMTTFERGWLTGLAFAYDKEATFWSAHVMAGRVELAYMRSPSAHDIVGEFDMPPLEMESWHRFGIIVNGPAVELWLDGKKVISGRHPDGKDLAGEIGIFHQRCRTERRVFRAGKVD
ncbi:MAG: hypothetical protein K8T90_01125 [Planctomycetes bacterium]|nr:hypothetical protein [Planctomycetota bacterium]